MSKFKKKSKIGLIEIKKLPEHKVRVYKNRLAIWRHDGERLMWDELQLVKNIILGNHAVAIEIYPEQNKVINIKNTRHLWILDDDTTDEILRQCKHPEFE